MSEYSRESRILALEDILEEEKEIKIKRQRSLLLDFYFNNMIQIVSQEIERAEFASFMSEFRTTLDQTSFAPLVFHLSPITKYSEYLLGTKTMTKTRERSSRSIKVCIKTTCLHSRV